MSKEIYVLRVDCSARKLSRSLGRAGALPKLQQLAFLNEILNAFIRIKYILINM